MAPDGGIVQVMHTACLLRNVRTLRDLLIEWVPGPEEQKRDEEQSLSRRWVVRARSVRPGGVDGPIPSGDWERLAVFPTRQAGDDYVVKVVPSLYTGPYEAQVSEDDRSS